MKKTRRSLNVLKKLSIIRRKPQLIISNLSLLFCAFRLVRSICRFYNLQTGCMSPKTVYPGISPCTLFMCSYNNWPKKTSTHQVHTFENCSPSHGNVHPAMELCASGTGCTLNFRQCLPSVRLTVLLLGPCHKHVQPIFIISCFFYT